MATVLTDADLPGLIDAAGTVAVCREAILAAHRGELTAPPRVHTELGDGNLVYTTGRLGDKWFGYRSYDTVKGGEQLVVVHDGSDGSVAGIAIGVDLGRMRTGAIGGVAADALAAPTASVAGIVGTGPQAWMQLWAINAVRPLSRVRVYSRNSERRHAFAANAAERYGIDVQAVNSAEAAAEGAEIVVLATSSGEPVLDTAAIDTEAFVSTLGPKQYGRAEFDVSLAERARLVTTDSVAQLHDYDPPFVLAGTPHEGRVVSLGSVLAGEAPHSAGALFCSVGLAGTEAYLLARLVGLT
ncbi:MAG TPA: ornithine cyclodeaminase family protein [Phytomonospora sp.]